MGCDLMKIITETKNKEDLEYTLMPESEKEVILLKKIRLSINSALNDKSVLLGIIIGLISGICITLLIISFLKV